MNATVIRTTSPKEQRAYLTENAYKDVLQKSIFAQIRQPIIYVSTVKG